MPLLDLNPAIDHIAAAEPEYTKTAAYIESSNKNVKELAAEFGISLVQLTELGAIVAAHQQMILTTIESTSANLPALTMPSVLATELYQDFCERHNVSRPVFRKAFTLAMMTIVASMTGQDPISLNREEAEEMARLQEIAARNASADTVDPVNDTINQLAAEQGTDPYQNIILDPAADPENQPELADSSSLRIVEPLEPTTLDTVPEGTASILFTVNDAETSGYNTVSKRYDSSEDISNTYSTADNTDNTDNTSSNSGSSD